MNKSISLTQVLTEIDRLDKNNKPIPFSIKFVTADRKKQTGGEIITIDEAIKVVGKKKGEVIIDKRKKKDIDIKTKNPNHWKNSTRNIMVVSSGEIRKIHIRLIIEFNGQNVYY